ncbi:MAG: AAA family ATPase [Bacillota bacterium]
MNGSVAPLSQRRDLSPEARTAALVAALRSPRCYGHPAESIEVLETHISYVVLAGAVAYKIKKPVTLPFLDFSSLSARLHFCDEELRLNRRTAPDIYLDVVPICGSVDEPRVGGSGEPIEHAVKMRRFSQGNRLDRMATMGSLDPTIVDQLAAQVAELHAGAPKADRSSEYGLPDTVLRSAFDNFSEIQALRERGSRAAIPAVLYAWTIDQHHVLADTLARRKAEGFVREGHGDLHLANIVLYEDRPVIFDCIEFSPALRWADVMSDVAFLMMDLIAHGRPRLAWRFLNAYLERTGDYGGLAVLRLYLVYRAMVRAKVACIRAAQLLPGHPQELEAEEEFASHIALAMRLIEPPKRGVVVMHGLSGSGKTTVSQALAESLGAVRIRSDVERKRSSGFDGLARTGAAVGAGLYTSRITDRTYEELASLARGLLRDGFTAIVDATFLARARRRRFEAIASAAHAPFAIVDCVAPRKALERRIATRMAIVNDASEAGLAVLEHQLETQEPLEDDEWMASIACDTTLEDCEDCVAAALERRLGRQEKETAACSTSTSSTATPTASARFIS